MSTPFGTLNDACGRYGSLYNTFQALNHDLELLKYQSEATADADNDDRLPAFIAVRITFVTQLNELVPIDVPLTKKILQTALNVVSSQLGELTTEISKLSNEAVAKISEAQCRKNPSSSTTPTTGSGSQSGQP